MRQVGKDLTAAITGRERTVRVKLSCDWDGDGHGPPGSVDDLSGTASQVQVGSVLQGTLPEQVNVVEGTGAATIDVDLAKGDTADERLQAVTYFSPFSATSPLAGKPRLGRDLRCDVEFLTAAGWQGVPLIRGVSRGLPVRVRDRKARLQGLDYRAKLRTPVALPAMAADVPANGNLFPVKPGMEATWIASYVLARCGYPMAPPPSPYCRYYAPMHGSAVAFTGKPFNGSPGAQINNLTTNTVVGPVPFTAGPFVLAIAAVTNPNHLAWIIDDPAPGTLMYGVDGRSAARVELWATTAGAVAFNYPTLAMGVVGANVNIYFSAGGINLQLTNNGILRTVIGPAWPQDGQWHHLGVQWDDAAGRADFLVDDAVTTVGFTPTPANPLAVADDWRVNFQTTLAAAEVHVATGIPFTTAWLPSRYPQPAVLDRLQNKLDGIVPGDALEGWLILQELVAAEQGAVWLDPDGRPHVASRAKLVSAAAQTPQRVVDATADLFDLAYDYHLDKVANIVTAPYQAITVAVQTVAWSLEQTVQIGSGQSATILASYTGLASSQRFLFGHANTASNGTGTQYTYGDGITPGPVTAAVTYTSDTTATIVVRNAGVAPVWLVGTTGSPDMQITGDVVTQATGPSAPVVTKPTSQAQYGDQPLTLPTNRWVQQRSFAWGMAMVTAGDLAQPQPVFTDLPIPGDPRLEFFDRLTAQDPGNTQLQQDVWYVGGTHTVDATGHYVQQLVARPARNRFYAGTGAAGVDLVG